MQNEIQKENSFITQSILLKHKAVQVQSISNTELFKHKVVQIQSYSFTKLPKLGVRK